MEIKAQEYVKILAEEKEQIEKYFGKSIEEVTCYEYEQYLTEKHPDKVEVVKE